MSRLEDIGDDRRAGKAGLPADDRDVTNGLVVPEPEPVEYWDRNWDGRPRCVRHGSMNRVDPVEQIYRCQMCGVGARWVSSHAEWLEDHPPRAVFIETEDGEHDAIFDVGRWARAAKTENDEKFEKLLHRMDAESALDDLEQPPGAYEVFTEVTIKVTWSEIFTFADGVLEHIDSLHDDTVGYAIDAILEPRYEGDKVEVVSLKTRAEYEEDVAVEVYREEREMSPERRYGDEGDEEQGDAGETE